MGPRKIAIDALPLAVCASLTAPAIAALQRSCA